MEKEPLKKRGRKPKGGKIMENLLLPLYETHLVQNVIVHLKCSMKDVLQPVHFSSYIEPYNASDTFHTPTELEIEPNQETNLYQKLKQLAMSLHMNENHTTRSDCFWCTCSFDNPSIYIPKTKLNEQYQVYGSFCCPECAAAFLFQEKLDDSTRFERYALLNYVYGKMHNYTKNIIPAPSPYYLLTKYFGSLTIQEYRKLIRKDAIIRVVDKPLCSIFPEIIQGNNEYSIPALKATKLQESAYKLCRKSTLLKGC
jgi:hypothetical protein